jgi:hypothetical protein
VKKSFARFQCGFDFVQVWWVFFTLGSNP